MVGVVGVPVIVVRVPVMAVVMIARAARAGMSLVAIVGVRLMRVASKSNVVGRRRSLIKVFQRRSHGKKPGAAWFL